MRSAVGTIIVISILALLGSLFGDGPIVKAIWAANSFVLAGMAVALNEIVTVIRENRRG